MKILLTGASGFLGSALSHALKEEGHQLVLLLRPSSSLRRLGDARFDIWRDLSDAGLVSIVQAMQPDVVVHTACSYGRLGETATQLVDGNLRFGLSLLQTLTALSDGLGGPRRFINTGTSLPADVSPYALAKQQFTRWGRMMACASPAQLRFVNVRLEHMYGHGDDESKFTTHVLHACHRNDPVLKLTLGTQRRDFIFIDDVVSAYSTLLTPPVPFHEPFVDIEVGSGVAVSVRDFVEHVHVLTGSRTALEFGALPYRANEVMLSEADLTDMRALGWQPRFDLAAGLKKTIQLEFE